MGSGFGKPGSTPPPRILRSIPSVENTRTLLIRITRLADIHFVIGISVTLERKFRSMYVHSAKNSKNESCPGCVWNTEVHYLFIHNNLLFSTESSRAMIITDSKTTYKNKETNWPFMEPDRTISVKT